MQKVSPQSFSTVVLAYVLSPDRKKTLMLYHNINRRDPSYGKYNGINGALNSNESLTECLSRLIYDETDAYPLNPRYRGNIHWARFGHQKESVMGHIFLVESLDREVVDKISPKGQIQWVEIDELLLGNHPIWAGDEHFLPLVFDLDPRPFHGFMPYEAGAPRTWSYERTQ